MVVLSTVRTEDRRGLGCPLIRHYTIREVDGRLHEGLPAWVDYACDLSDCYTSFRTARLLYSGCARCARWNYFPS